MKKILFTLWALGAFTSLWASNSEISGWWVYAVTDNTVAITYKGSSAEGEKEYEGDLVIPETLYDGTKYYTVVKIGNEAFWGCTGLTSLTIPSTVTSIGELAFESCIALKSVTIEGSGLTTIGRMAFSNCNVLTALILPSSLESIGDNAFIGCYELSSIVIPASVTSIGKRAFQYCNALKSINVYPNNPAYSSLSDVLFNKDQTTLVCYPIGKTATTYTVPATVREIGTYAFENAKKLKTINLPDSLKLISEGAFYNCASLTKITIPATVDTIGDRAFYWCEGLTSITCKAVIPPICNENKYCFYDVDKSIPVFVPAESVALYKSAPAWHEFTNIQPIPEEEGIEELQYGNGEGAKHIENGVLYIERNGRTFTIQGQEIK